MFRALGLGLWVLGLGLRVLGLGSGSRVRVLAIVRRSLLDDGINPGTDNRGVLRVRVPSKYCILSSQKKHGRG